MKKIKADSKEELLLNIILFLQDKGEIKTKDIDIEASSVSEATVYRTINFFYENNLISRDSRDYDGFRFVLTEKGESILY